MSVLLQDCKADDWIAFDWGIFVTTSSPFLQSQLDSTSMAGSATASGDNSQCFRCAEGDVEGTEGVTH